MSIANITRFVLGNSTTTSLSSTSTPPFNFSLIILGSQLFQYQNTFIVINSNYLRFYLVIGTLCNLLAFIVIRKSPTLRQTSTSLYLQTLCIVDIAALIIKLFNMELDKYQLNLEMCRFTSYLGNLSNYCSTWLLIVMAIDKFIAVKWPLQVQRLNSKSKAKKVIIFIFLLMAILSLMHPLSLIVKKRVSKKKSDMICEYRSHFSAKLIAWVDSLLWCAVPIIVLVILNSLIALSLNKSLQQRRDILQPSTNSIRSSNSSMINFSKITCQFHNMKLFFHQLFCCFSTNLIKNTFNNTKNDSSYGMNGNSRNFNLRRIFSNQKNGDITHRNLMVTIPHVNVEPENITMDEEENIDIDIQKTKPNFIAPIAIFHENHTYHTKPTLRENEGNNNQQKLSYHLDFTLNPLNVTQSNKTSFQYKPDSIRQTRKRYHTTKVRKLKLKGTKLGVEGNSKITKLSKEPNMKQNEESKLFVISNSFTIDKRISNSWPIKRKYFSGTERCEPPEWYHVPRNIAPRLITQLQRYSSDEEDQMDLLGKMETKIIKNHHSDRTIGSRLSVPKQKSKDYRSSFASSPIFSSFTFTRSFNKFRRHTRAALESGTSNNAGNSLYNTNRYITFMLVVVILVYVILNVPVSVFYMYTSIHPKPSVKMGTLLTSADYDVFLKYRYLQCLFYWLADLNHVINFFLYCVSSSKFRKVLSRLLMTLLHR
ncbi:hypothetical protein SNEBB_005791 [Seison nebaliae]|nr:hypothetical protein SNEBB_005791 [Seison nebaliae]